MTKLDSYLKQRGISRRSLSRKSGIDVRTVFRLCNGQSNGRVDTWRAIVRALGCRLEDVVD